MELNINRTGTVTLTTQGKNILDKYRTTVEKETNRDLKTILQYDGDGKYSTELWNLMNIFGEHLYNGSELVFHKNIIDME